MVNENISTELTFNRSYYVECQVDNRVSPLSFSVYLIKNSVMPIVFVNYSIQRLLEHFDHKIFYLKGLFSLLIFTVRLYIYIYITNLVCYTYFHWFFSPECQHIFGKQTGVYISVPKKD